METFNDAENTYDKLKTFIDDTFYKLNGIKIEWEHFDGNKDQENFSITITVNNIFVDIITINIDCYIEEIMDDGEETFDIRYSYINNIVCENIIDYKGERFLSSVKNDIQKLFNSNIYASSDESDEDLIKLPVFNEGYYNEWIDHILTIKPHLVKFAVYDNLIDTMKTKWNYLFNANKFDLI